jgi:rare lipoprotein A
MGHLNRLVTLVVAILLLRRCHQSRICRKWYRVRLLYRKREQNRERSTTEPSALTAAHRSLAFGTKVRVLNQKNGHSVIVTINDRGPFVRGRIIDVTPAGARALGFSGLAPVTIEPQ